MSCIQCWPPRVMQSLHLIAGRILIMEVLHNLCEAITDLFRYPTTGRRTKHPWMNSTPSLITRCKPCNNRALLPSSNGTLCEYRTRHSVRWRQCACCRMQRRVFWRPSGRRQSNLRRRSVPAYTYPVMSCCPYSSQASSRCELLYHYSVSYCVK